ncbi:16S rRNA (guanine(966)-N(2))-methyltransferase RsmD [Bacillus sp. HMF5848]|uniref:16S rRNA (guanine(966)-N(2))-methyltransferase RsmD n=1 Tax=Bacillus sp. HMF5848 TaxID=2495421 RepID=UPI000F7A886A|nr:16S rRNA (guanine(966)-N(2))-methyltransferase RsmD [Bacillus sp. HMF5848]RSK26918.1 16S rRNA (guanine(966)-N(2))-methyltransferase RsmD [Bacillus sp. HMF5848]
MRVVAGQYKGRALRAVPGRTTRPTTDKVKESIFNMVGPFFNHGHGLDLFAGSGSLGIEALSRGFEKVIFVDQDMKAIQTIKENVHALSLNDQVEIYRNDARRALKAITKRDIKFDGVFLDPPYKMNVLSMLIETIDKHELLNNNGFILAEHGDETVLPEKIGELSVWKQELYGGTKITIYKYT